jgi:hypothetical protein
MREAVNERRFVFSVRARFVRRVTRSLCAFSVNEGEMRKHRSTSRRKARRAYGPQNALIAQTSHGSKREVESHFQ